jgi:hypothetical protein
MSKRPAHARSRLHPTMTDAEYVRSPEGQAAIRATMKARGVDVDKIDKEIAAEDKRKPKAA